MAAEDDGACLMMICLANVLSSLFLLLPLSSVFPPYAHSPGGCEVPEAQHISLCSSSEDGAQRNLPAVRLLPPLLTWRMEITQAFEDAHRERSLPSPQEEDTFLKGRACYRLQKKGLCGNERDSGLWSCSKSAAFLTFRSQQR